MCMIKFEGVTEARSFNHMFEVIKALKVKEILLEIGIIEEMKTTYGPDKEVPHIFFHNSPFSRKYNLISLTPYIGNSAFHNFVTSQKKDFAKFLADKETRCLHLTSAFS